MELMKLAANSQARPSLFHFRTSSGQEVGRGDGDSPDAISWAWK